MKLRISSVFLLLSIISICLFGKCVSIHSHRMPSTIEPFVLQLSNSQLRQHRKLFSLANTSWFDCKLRFGNRRFACARELFKVHAIRSKRCAALDQVFGCEPWRYSERWSINQKRWWPVHAPTFITRFQLKIQAFQTDADCLLHLSTYLLVSSNVYLPTGRTRSVAAAIEEEVGSIYRDIRT